MILDTTTIMHSAVQNVYKFLVEVTMAAFEREKELFCDWLFLFDHRVFIGVFAIWIYSKLYIMSSFFLCVFLKYDDLVYLIDR